MYVNALNKIENEKADFSAHMNLNMNLDELSECIISKNKPEAFRFIEIAYSRLLETDGLLLSDIQKFTIEILLAIIHAVKTVEGNSDILFDDYMDLFQNVFKIKFVKEIKEWLKETVSKYIDLLLSEDEKMSPVVKKTIEYIQSNFSENINLKTISSEFNISPAYLGYLFTKEVGDNFANYLNKMRIKKARELLLSTNLKKNEISDRIGYINVNYFYNVFKKITGTSPNEFKSKVLY